MTKERFESEYKKIFKDRKIVKLKDITKKIAIISKVRVTKKREFTDYDEISLNNINDYGEVFVVKGTANLGAANRNSINSQSLNYGDLVLNQRTSKMKVGFIGKKYERVIVGNNSMIRIQFDSNKIDTARFVQLYLQLEFVQEYLNSLPSCSKADRKILSSAQLQELPIPEYIEKEQLISLSEVLYPRMELLSLAHKMQNDAQRLIERYENHKMESIQLNFQTKLSDDLFSKDKEDIELFMRFREFYSRLLV